MNELLKKIFDNVNTVLPQQVSETESELSEETMKILQELESVIPEEYHDELEAKVFEVSGIAERSGFELGMKYMIRLLLECMS